MTKYILNSGGLKNEPERTKVFFSEAAKGLGKTPRVLIVYFALPREIWNQKFKENKENTFIFFPKEIDPTFELALPETFEEQIQHSNIIYMHGGDNYLIEENLKKFDIPKIWESKVIITNSASSIILSKYAWACDYRRCVDGLGILPIKFLPHYQSLYGSDDSRGPINWQKALEELKNYKEDLPIYALKEGEYVVIEK